MSFILPFIYGELVSPAVFSVTLFRPHTDGLRSVQLLAHTHVCILASESYKTKVWFQIEINLL